MDELGKPGKVNSGRDRGKESSRTALSTSSRAGEAHAFILRLWAEPRELDRHAPVWRGSISNLRDENRRYFASWNALETLISDAIGVPAVFGDEQT